MRMRPRLCCRPSEEHRADDIAFHIGEAAADAIVFERELFVVEAEEVEDGGAEVVERVDVLHGAAAEVVCGPVADAWADAGTGEPAREAIRIVVASG